MAVHADDLDRLQCAVPGCDHKDHRELVLHGRCHIKSPTWVIWDRLRRVAIVRCAECNNIIAELAISEG